MTTLETITQVLLEELQVPDPYQLTLVTTTSIHLSRPHIPLYFYIEIEPDHITITEWERENTTIPYANPRLIEQIQETIDNRIARKEADYHRYNNRVTR